MAYEARVTQTHSSNGLTKNSSQVTITFQIRRLDYAMIGYNYNANQAYYELTCDGQSTKKVYFTFNWNSTPAGTWWTVGSHTFTVPHKDDGTKSINFGGYYYTGISPSSFTASGTTTLTTIPRYASITSFKVSSTALLSASFAWSASNDCDAVEYSLNDGDFISTSGNTFTVAGLSPETKYNIKIRVKRTDSQLWTTGSNISFTTLPIASISNTSLSCNIGEELNLTFKNYNNNASYLKLYAKNTSEAWTLIASTTGIQTSSYSWDLSSYASSMYALCPNSNTLNIKVVCGATFTSGGSTFSIEHETLGVAAVINSDPTFSTFTFQNTDVAIINLIGTTSDMISSRGNLRISISSANKAVALNGASISKYVVKITIGDITLEKKQAYSQDNIDIDVGAFQTTGVYTINIAAIDTRGNSTNATEQSFTVYPYHTPSLTASFTRINGFEAETLINLKSLISRLSVNGSDKNSIQSLQYRCAESGTLYPESYTDITGYTTTSSDDDYVYTLVSTDDNPFTTFDTNKTYNVEILVTDAIESYTLVVNVSQGVPGMTVLDNGKVLVRTIPNEGNVTDAKADVIVANDVKAKGVYLAESIDALEQRLELSNPDYKMDSGKITSIEGTAGWVHLGSLYSTKDSHSTIVDVFSGDGYNARANQNTWLRIMIKNGYQETVGRTESFGITYEVFGCEQNDDIEVLGIATDYQNVDIYVYLPWGWSRGYYVISGQYDDWTHIDTFASSAPTGEACGGIKRINYIRSSGGTMRGQLVCNDIQSQIDDATITDLHINNDGGDVYIQNSQVLTLENHVSLISNKVLWSGGWYMTSIHTATLSEKISAQAHGVIFVWSAYVNGAPENNHFSYHFVPKSHISNFSGRGIDMTMFTSNWAHCATKYLYVTDTTVTGHNNNNVDSVGSGVDYDNNYWVLRQIIGV